MVSRSFPRESVSGRSSQVQKENDDLQTLGRSARSDALMTVPEVAVFLRTTSKAIYAMIERGQLPGVVRLGRRVLVRRDDLRALVGLLDVDHPNRSQASADR
jgi:excisionase family DNA binding protein